MANLIVEISKYLMIFFLAFYTFACFSVLRQNINIKKQKNIFKVQIILMYLIHLLAFWVIYTVTVDAKMIGLYIFQVILISTILVFYHFCYKNVSQIVLNNMSILLIIGFIILSRLSYEKAIKQSMIAAISVGIACVIPYIIRKMKTFRKLTWFYAAAGIFSLLVVNLYGELSFGAKISIVLGNISIQPSELVKILFVFFMAGMFYEVNDLKQVCIVSIVAIIHVLILVFSRDLGGALILFVTYLIMLYVATQKLLFFAGGIFCGSIAAIVAYVLFPHVRIRVVAWLDPLVVIENEGYQLSQSLFAIGTGGWFGTGLYHGLPNKIPVVEQDFIFSAISEELGGIFALCLLMICVSCFIMFLNIAMQMNDRFYKLVALGLGTIYGFQVFLTIGGSTKFIPSTGVTLPLVSYGGSSLFATMIVFAIIQGFYIVRQDERMAHEKTCNKISKIK